MKKNLGIIFLSRRGWVSFLFHLIVILNFYLITNSAKCYATNYLGGMAELLTALSAPNTNTFTATSDVTLTQSLGSITGTSLSLFGNNSRYGLNGTTTYAGITVASGQTLNISNFGSVNSSGTVVDSISNFKKTASGSTVDATTSGAVAYNSGTLNITNSVFSANNAYAGGVLYNSGTATVTGSNFSNNSNSASGSGGAIYNAGTETISGSTFNSNTSTNGGAIYNSGTSIITNSIFTNNTAFTSGGAIYNANATSYLDIIADKGVTSFTGNTAGGVSNAIYLNDGMLNLNAGNGGYILFNDKISSFNSSNVININKTGDGTAVTGFMPATAPTNGNVIFNNTVSNATLNLVSGMLTLGKYGNTLANYLSNDALAISGGDLNTANGIIDTNNVTNLTVTNTPGLYLDANLSNGNSDKLSVSGTGSGNLTVKGVNILADGTSSITAVNGATSPTLTTTSLNAYTNGYKYQFSNPSTGTLSVSSQTATSGNGGLYDAVSDATAGRLYRSFAATGNVALSSNLGSQGLPNSTLTIFGNQKNIDALNGGTNYSGITTSAGQTLNIYDAGSVDGSGNVLTSIKNFVKGPSGTTTDATTSGGVVYNSGNVNIANSAISSNSAYKGGAVYTTTGTANISDSTFANNSVTSAGGAIFKNSGTSAIVNSAFKGNNITTTTAATASPNGGAISNNTGALTIANSTFTNNIISTTTNAASANALPSGGAIYNGSGTTTITGSTFTGNNVTSTALGSTSNAYSSGAAIANSTTTNIYNSTFTNNSVAATATQTAIGQGGAIFNNNVITIDNSDFTTNSSKSYGGAIYNSKTATITNCRFTGNTAPGVSGGAIYGGGAGVTTNISDSVFDNNSSIYGGAIINRTLATTNITNCKFINNNTNSSSQAGAIYTETTGTVNDTGSEFINNVATSGGAIYNTGTTNLTRDTFTNNGITSGGTAISIQGGAIYNFNANTITNPVGTITITDSLFNGNLASTTVGAKYGQGGAIYSNASTTTAIATTATLNINNSKFGDIAENKAYSSTSSSGTNAAAYGGGIYNIASTSAASTASAAANANILNNSVFNANKVSVDTTGLNSSASAYGGAIYNAATTASTTAAATATATQTISNATFTNNKAIANTTNGGTATANAYGGAIYNTSTTTSVASTASTAATVNVTNSTFTGNSASGTTNGPAINACGGAIYNSQSALGSGTATATVTLTNSTFNSNTASTYGGAIYNAATLNIIADNGTTSFTDNKAAGIFNALYMAGGTTNINAGNSGIVRFNDKITSSGIANVINVNKTDLGFVHDGQVIFNENISNATINLYDGTLTFGESGNTRLTNATGLLPSNSYLNNVNLNLTGGTLNLQNNNVNDVLNLNSFTSTIGSSLKFDANLSNNQNDTINASSASGTLNISNLNIVTDGTDSTLALFSSGISPTLTAFNAYSTNYKYSFTPSATLGVYNVSRTPAGLNIAVWDTSASRSFSATADTSAVDNLSTMGGTNSTLNINGNNHNINGANYTGVSVASGQTLNIDGVGSLNANGTVNKSWNGFVSTNGGGINNAGTLNVSNSVISNNNATTSGGAIYNSGTATITNNTFAGNTASTAGGAVYNTGTTTVSGNNFTGNSATNGGAIYNTGTTTLTDTNFTNNTATTSGGAIYNTGTLNIKASAGGTTTFSGNNANGISNAIHLSGGTVHVNTGANGTITFADKITSSSNANVININGAADPTLNSGTVNFNNTVSNATIKLYNGTMALGNDSNINGNNMELYGGTVNMINNAVGTMSLNSLALTGTTNLKIDADLANGTADKITSATPVTGTGHLNVNRVNLLSDSTTTKNITIADANVKNYVQVSASTAESALYKYNLSYDSSNGTMGFVNTHQFTPSILTPQVAATVGTYLTQTATYHEVFNNVDTLMFLPRADRLLMQQNNKVASADDNFVFSPTFLPEQSKGLWFKQFTTFENVPLNNGPNVSNVGYGALIGGDTELEYLGHGYSGYLTAYTGYNGSHQNYDHVGTYQNGGLLGLTGTVYKGNFFAALTANMGASNANANTTTGTDNFTMLTAGTAIKTGYNFELFSGKFIIQPSYTMSYTFAKTFDYTTTSGANITSDPLNAIQISPGIKFIGNLRNGWQPYTGVSMVWNIMDSQRFYANEVQLPQMSVAPYVEYGVGLQRKWAEKFTGFAQTMLRGGGRNGVALQFGFRWAIGK